LTSTPATGANFGSSVFSNQSFPCRWMNQARRKLPEERRLQSRGAADQEAHDGRKQEQHDQVMPQKV
jgi:hypothetical protein